MTARSRPTGMPHRCRACRWSASTATSARRSPTPRPTSTRWSACSTWSKPSRAAGIALHHLDFGGGLGIDYNGDTPPAADALWQQLLARLDARGFGQRQLIIEPGRSLVGNAGVCVTEVLYTKPGEDKNFCIVDAAMNDLPRPAMYQAFHQIVPVARRAAAMRDDLRRGGPGLRKRRLDRPRPRAAMCEPGDLLAVLSAGAYCMSMASNYNTRGRAAEVLVSGDRRHADPPARDRRRPVAQRTLLERLQAGRGAGLRCARALPARIPDAPAQQHGDDRGIDERLRRSRSCPRASRRSAAGPARRSGRPACAASASACAPSALIARLNEVAASGVSSTKALKPTRMNGRLAMSLAISARSKPMSNQAVAQQVHARHRSRRTAPACGESAPARCVFVITPQRRHRQHDAEEAQRPVAGRADQVLGRVGAQAVGEGAVDQPRERQQAQHEHQRLGRRVQQQLVHGAAQ